MIHVLGPPTISSLAFGAAIWSGQAWAIALFGMLLGFTIAMSIVIFRMR